MHGDRALLSQSPLGLIKVTLLNRTPSDPLRGRKPEASQPSALPRALRNRDWRARLSELRLGLVPTPRALVWLRWLLVRAVSEELLL